METDRRPRKSQRPQENPRPQIVNLVIERIDHSLIPLIHPGHEHEKDDARKRQQ